MADRDLAGAHYRAFLSYSHKDGAAAARLHRRLEAYRIPKRLAGRDTARGPVPRRLMPIFRDREELPAATDLSETVREALARSGALIVLCSPAAATSLWVAEEIRVFRELHPTRPILAAILEGDPPDCFPPVLRETGEGHEPLATDLRRDGDGERLGLLKLVAGIAGLGLDDLVQRDATRRVRRVMAVTAAAVLVALGMAALAWVAVSARQEAERQRAEAEGLMEFMLSDLHDRLEGVGRLDIMSSVNQRALDYYDRRIARGEGTQSVVLRRAWVMHGLGEDDLLQGKVAAAFARFREADRITTAELTAAPDGIQPLRLQSQSDYWLGEVHALREEWADAARHYRRAVALTRRLVAREPGNPEHRLFAGGAAVGLGTVEMNGLRDYPAAQRSYEAAVRWFEDVVRVRPQNVRAQLALANAHGWLADSYFMRGMIAEALAARLRQYPIVERLRRNDPANAEAGYRLALAQRALADALVRNGQRDRAGAMMFEAYGRAQRLTQLDPDNMEWLLFRGIMGCQLYFGTLDTPPGTDRAGLARDIREVESTLRAQRNPSASQLANCVDALNRVN